jgi:hypothetical protein
MIRPGGHGAAYEVAAKIRHAFSVNFFRSDMHEDFPSVNDVVRNFHEKS